MKRFTKKNISKIPSGYYWVRNDGFDLTTGVDKVIYRIVEVIVREKAETISGFWKPAGVFYRSIGASYESHLNEIMDWTNVSLTPITVPEGF